MKEYLLFIDTETSGLPKNWNKPYTAEGNWPYAVQVAWIVFTKEGEKIKQQNHYIKNTGFIITAAAQKIHDITPEFLTTNGENRQQVMQALSNDFAEYQPLVVGHFMKLDYHIIAVEFLRAGLTNPLSGLPTFCTMMATHHLVQNPSRKYLRLSDLYELLFKEEPDCPHNALSDATATAQCFFELQKRGEVNESLIDKQQTALTKSYEIDYKPVSLSDLIVILLILLITYILWKSDFSFLKK